jgi:hypothetical protein
MDVPCGLRQWIVFLGTNRTLLVAYGLAAIEGNDAG